MGIKDRLNNLRDTSKKYVNDWVDERRQRRKEAYESKKEEETSGIFRCPNYPDCDFTGTKEEVDEHFKKEGLFPKSQTPKEKAEIEERKKSPFLKRMRGAVVRDVYAWIPAVISLIVFVWLGTSTGNTLILAGGVLFSLSLAFSKGEYFGAFKAIIKFVGILLLSWGFLSIYPFAGLIALFLGYISMPVKVRVKEEEQTYNNAVGFSRMILGIMLSIFILNVLGGDSALKIPMFLIALGFFFAIPEASEEIPKGTGVNIINYMGKGGSDAFAFVSGLLILIGVALGMMQLVWGSATWIIFGSVGLVGAFTAFRSHAAERGTMGAPIVALLLITLSTSYPALLGESIFGAWWPSVESSITSITAPLGDAWTQASSGMGSAFSMVTNPTAYYEQQMAQQQASANIKSGGTTKSIEVSGDFLINNVPEQPLLASATLENRGEFKATNIKATLTQLQTKSKDRGVLSPQPDVAYKFVTCSGATPTETNSAGDTCTWPEPSYNGDMKLMTFTYGDKNVWGDIGKCVCAVGSDKSGCIPTDDDINGCKYCYTNDAKTAKCADSGGIIEYPYAGKTVSVGFNYSFDYIVNVSLDLQLMQSDTLNDLLLKKQIRLQDVEAQYSGGPVRASIWTMKQPVRAGEDTLAVITILNQGAGTVKSGAEYVLTIPFISGMKAEDLKITEVSSSGLKCENPVAKTDSYELRCNLEKDLGKQKDAKYGFIFSYNNIPKTVDSKTVLFVGNVNYEYQNSYAKETQITWAPPQ
ncbi:MAG: hypothetical protein KKB25_02325 [Nanoarchaeota archaeon]|nr:hypothetical protein [Nanoarchaeota archaeon]